MDILILNLLSESIFDFNTKAVSEMGSVPNYTVKHMNQEKYTKSQIKIKKSHYISTEAAETETKRNASILICKLCEKGFNRNSEMKEHFLAKHIYDINFSKNF